MKLDLSCMHKIKVSDLFSGDKALLLGIFRGTGSVFHCTK